jgi:hypothetical protein
MDPLRRADSVPSEQIKANIDQAYSACKEAAEAHPNDGHYEFLLARTLMARSDLLNEITHLRRAASDGSGYAAAFNSISGFIEEMPQYKDEADQKGKFHLLRDDFARACNDRVLLSSFPVAYKFLKGRDRDENDRETLKWLTDRAARIGVPEAHVALADDFPATNAEKWLHLQLAAKLVEEDKTGAAHIDVEAIRARAEQIQLRDEESNPLQQEVRAWRREPLFEIPSETWKLLTPTLH